MHKHRKRLTILCYAFTLTANPSMLYVVHVLIYCYCYFICRDKSTDQTGRVADHRRSLHGNIFGFTLSNEKHDIRFNREKNSTNSAVGQRCRKFISHRISSNYPQSFLFNVSVLF